MSRFLKESATEYIRARHPNRPAVGRELLALLGCELDIDPALLLNGKDAAANDWTTENGASLEAATNQGTVEMMADVLKLDGQNEDGYVLLTGLPQGAYMLRCAASASATVAGDLGIKVRNATDATDILAEVARATVAGATTYRIFEVPFSVRAADVGDALRAVFTKKTATANIIRVDYVSVHPLSARKQAWGEVPDGGRSVPAYANGAVDTITIYDALTAGNVIETATFAYNGDGTVDTITRTRDGRTRTTTYGYTGGNVTSIKHEVS